MKTLIIALVTLIAGGIAGYYIAAQKCGSLDFLDKDAKEAFKKQVINSYREKLLAERLNFVDPPTIRIVPPEFAKSLIQEYLRQNESVTDPLQQVRTRGALLRGFFISSDAIKKMSDEFGKDFAGISLYIAKHPDDMGIKSNKLTVVASSAKRILAGDLDANKPNLIFTNGAMWEYVDPCPTNCGTGDGDGDGGPRVQPLTSGPKKTPKTQ
ncbi:hypothetical protein [Mucilaginibacter terrae]|uniref:DUF2939 domain-containing protein n=1 Tax=Mucilaginibacter terrae TaxID=1955052 RepID=A0ABU3H032_9SPHI|nr:hypothetical protein [Mucilaginibacter terrae]MDT3404602.1 hypothetical protein [Mucilaginibacter terrae]